MTLDQRYALISFSYNHGNVNTICANIFSCDDLHKAWTTAAVRGKNKDGEKVVLNGLVKRREAEYKIYVYGIYDSAH